MHASANPSALPNAGRSAQGPVTHAPVTQVPAARVAALRARISAIAADGGARMLEGPRAIVSLGHQAADRALGGGLLCGGLHELRPDATGDSAAATGFALACAARLGQRPGRSGPRPWLWVRQDLAAYETGAPYGPGLAAFGLDPARLVLVAAADAKDALRAAEEGLRCPALAVVLLEPWGDPRALDLTATRRLALAAETSGVPALMLRSGGHAGPGGATTRWTIAAAPSDALPSRGAFPGIGQPRFAAALERSRQPGSTGEPGRWIMEWNPDECLFREPAAPPLARPATPADRPAAPGGAAVRPLRRAG